MKQVNARITGGEKKWNWDVAKSGMTVYSSSAVQRPINTSEMWLFKFQVAFSIKEVYKFTIAAPKVENRAMQHVVWYPYAGWSLHTDTTPHHPSQTTT